MHCRWYASVRSHFLLGFQKIPFAAQFKGISHAEEHGELSPSLPLSKPSMRITLTNSTSKGSYTAGSGKHTSKIHYSIQHVFHASFPGYYAAMGCCHFCIHEEHKRRLTDASCISNGGARTTLLSCSRSFPSSAGHLYLQPPSELPVSSRVARVELSREAASNLFGLVTLGFDG